VHRDEIHSKLVAIMRRAPAGAPALAASCRRGLPAPRTSPTPTPPTLPEPSPRSALYCIKHTTELYTAPRHCTSTPHYCIQYNAVLYSAGCHAQRPCFLMCSWCSASEQEVGVLHRILASAATRVRTCAPSSREHPPLLLSFLLLPPSLPPAPHPLSRHLRSKCSWAAYRARDVVSSPHSDTRLCSPLPCAGEW